MSFFPAFFQIQCKLNAFLWSIQIFYHKISYLVRKNELNIFSTLLFCSAIFFVPLHFQQKK
ncbi:MAG: hypothetical protein AUK44_01590 [Porphyromonadaceae bacterium CG2_30_38_12]|nr:MAG: hypothetical protein AUK44_01590 [Porphyromonadaceae bacterium CG2_30_38_12]